MHDVRIDRRNHQRVLVSATCFKLWTLKYLQSAAVAHTDAVAAVPHEITVFVVASAVTAGIVVELSADSYLHLIGSVRSAQLLGIRMCNYQSNYIRRKR